MLAAGLVTVIVTFIYCCVILFLRQKINMAIEITKEATNALSDMPMMLAFPIFPAISAGLYFFWFIVVSLYIFAVYDLENAAVPSILRKTQYSLTFSGSVGVEQNPWYNTVNYSKATWNENLKRAFALNFFHCLWNIQFFIYTTFFVLAGAVADWYFTPYVDGNKPRGSEEGKLTERPVVASFWRYLRYHTGTVIAGAFIIAVVNFIRACIEYAEQQAKKASESQSETAKRMQACIFCCLRCLAKCIHDCLDQISKYSFVYSSIYGSNFLVSSCNSFRIVFNNLSSVAAVSMVGDIIIGIGKIFICVCTTAIFGLVLDHYPYFDNKIQSNVLPLVFIFLISYCIASLYMTVYETTVDTIFLCFMVDLECNKASGRMLASEGLQQLVGAHSDASKAIADGRTALLKAPSPSAPPQ